MGLRRAALLLAAFACTLTACAVPWDVETYQASGANVAALKTFYWRGGDFRTAAMPSSATTAATEERVRSRVVAELERKGFRETTAAEQADFVVSYQVSAVSKFVVDENPRIGAPSATTVLRPGEIQPPPASAVPREVTVRDGSVVMFIDDRASGRQLWRGEVAGESRAGSSEHLSRIIAQMMFDIARQLPPRSDVAH